MSFLFKRKKKGGFATSGNVQNSSTMTVNAMVLSHFDSSAFVGEYREGDTFTPNLKVIFTNGRTKTIGDGVTISLTKTS